MTTAESALLQLEAFVGEWEMEATFPGMAPVGGARTSFEWMPGKRLLVQRWTIPIPEAPDGLAVYGYDEGHKTLLQHYFDTRGVVRVYQMTVDGGVWRLERTKADFSPLDFSQRFNGRFSRDGNAIVGTWELAHDHVTYEKDFDLSYTRI
jgi:hypothetical protein